MSQISESSLASDPNLQGYWRMESNWNDTSSNSYNLTPNNSPTFATGRYGQAGSLSSSSSQYSNIARASCANIRISGSQSWVCWVNQTTITSYQSAMGMSNSDGGTSAGITTSADSSNIVYFTLPGLTTNTQVNSGSSVLSTGSWFHIAGVYDASGNTLKIYINGVESGSVTASGSKTDITSGGFALGARGDATNFFNGLIDDAAIFNRVLTPTEILELASGSSPSSSVSPSLSISLSQSSSISLSPSISISLSPSVTPSSSISSSDSASVSPSSSTSLSVSASPSAPNYSDKYTDNAPIYSSKYSDNSPVYTDKYREY